MGLPREGVGAEKVRYVPRNPGKPDFLAGYPRDFAGISQGHRKSSRNKLVLNFWRLNISKTFSNLAKTRLKLAEHGRFRFRFNVLRIFSESQEWGIGLLRDKFGSN